MCHGSRAQIMLVLELNQWWKDNWWKIDRYAINSQKHSSQCDSLYSLKVSRHDLGRDEFVKEIWKWRNHYGNRIIEQIVSWSSVLPVNATTHLNGCPYSEKWVQVSIGIRPISPWTIIDQPLYRTHSSNCTRMVLSIEILDWSTGAVLWRL